ncbi:hypothetical protein MAR_017657, partial [Mya arenaria]
ATILISIKLSFENWTTKSQRQSLTVKLNLLSLELLPLSQRQTVVLEQSFPKSLTQAQVRHLYQNHTSVAFGLATIEQLFDWSKLVHNYSSCNQKDCASISSHEIQRLTPRKSGELWLCYVEEEGMFCLICRKHNIKHRQNLKEVFAASPILRVKVEAVTTHSTSTLYSSALEGELLQRLSNGETFTLIQLYCRETDRKRVVETQFMLCKNVVDNFKSENAEAIATFSAEGNW